MGNSRKLIVILGPTASGKSALAIKIAKKIGGEIISADSRQVYRGMDIGTGKVLRNKALPVQVKSRKLKVKSYFYSEGIRHHLLDVASPKKQFSVARYKTLAQKALQDIARRGKIPIICGGTGLYIDTLLERIPVPEVPPNLKLRAKLEKKSTQELFELLSTLDLRRSTTIDRHNPRRLIRALEIVLTTGKPVASVQSQKSKVESYTVLYLGVNPGKKVLAKRIEKRLDQRFKQGMIKEVERLHKNGVSWKRLESFGLEYRWIAKYLQSNQSKVKRQKLKKTFSFRHSTLDYLAMREALLRDIVRYSKRQMTWFKRNQEIHWIKNQNEAEGLVRNTWYLFG